MVDARPRSVSRRRVLQAIAASSAMGLAGCQGDGDDDNDGTDAGDGGDGENEAQELGERVPTIVLGYWSSFGSETKTHQDMVPVPEEGWLEAGIPVEVQGIEAFESHGYVLNDDREGIPDVATYSTTSRPTNVDPDEYCRNYAIDWAGPNGLANTHNYANCEYTKPAIQQQQAENREQRRELVNECRSIASNEAAVIPLATIVLNSAWRPDAVEVAGIGSKGINQNNPRPYIISNVEGDTLFSSIRQSTIQTLNWLTRGDPSINAFYNLTLHSPLLEYNVDLELENMLASNYEDESPTEKVVELRDAEFHNGDPITASDVKFTYEFLNDNSEEITYFPEIPLEEVEVIDETTARFVLSQPHAPLHTKVLPLFGILHEPSLEGAKDGPADFSPDPETYVGSGPYALDDWEARVSLSLVPHPTGHPVYDPGHDITFRGFDSTGAITQALINGEIDVAGDLTNGDIETLNQQASDVVETHQATGYSNHDLEPQYHIPPTKFFAFRDALGTAIDRELLNEVAFDGQSEYDTYSALMPPNHPWRPPEDMLHQFTDDPTGDVEAARQKLLDAGFGWDDDGNLRYPADADLSPLWPEGEFPQPEDFPCVDGEGGLSQDFLDSL
jgi:peptide/nickel transport system substrate-binding protein